MKRYYSIIAWAFIAMMSFSVISCNNNDDEDKESLIGVWVSEKSMPVTYESKIVGYVITYFQFMEDGSLLEKDVITNSDNYGKVYTETSTYGKWSSTDNRLILTVSFADPNDNPKEKADVIECTYMFKDGKLILSHKDDESGEMVVVPFVRSQMPELSH